MINPFILSSHIPSTSSCNSLNDYSFSSWFSHQNSSNDLDDYLKVMRNLSQAIISKKFSNYKPRQINRGFN